MYYCQGVSIVSEIKKVVKEAYSTKFYQFCIKNQDYHDGLLDDAGDIKTQLIQDLMTEFSKIK